MAIQTEHMRTVAELIEELKQAPQDAFVVLCKSPGADQGFRPYSPEIEIGTYVPDATWNGEFYSDDTKGDREYYYPHPDVEQLKAVCLYPVY